MERPMFTNFVIVQFFVAIFVYFSSSNFILSGNVIESPRYTVVHSKSEFQVRLYRECTWMSARVRETTSFKKSTKDGFHGLYQYIHGADLNSTRVAMSAPVLTSVIFNSSSKQGSSKYYTRLYLATKYPQPLPELNLQLDNRTSHYIAVIKFSGFVEDDNIGKQVESLRNSPNKHVNIISGKAPLVVDKNSFSIAQFNSSHHLTGRLNELRVNVVSGSTAEGYLPYQVEVLCLILSLKEYWLIR